MIRLWLSRDQTVPVREQLSAQFILGILSRRLRPGEKLPSVRALAQRLHLHPNTISSVYRDLTERGWVSARHGSGVFVKEVHVPEPGNGVDGLVRAWMEEGLARGLSVDAMEEAFARVLGEYRAESRSILVVDPEDEFAEVLAAELREVVTCSVGAAAWDGAKACPASVCVVMNAAHEANVVGRLKPASHAPVSLKSMEEFLAGQTRPATPILIAVVSRSASILRWASTLLSALGFAESAVVLRNPAEAGWREGLASCDLVAADLVAAAELPAELPAIVFRVIAPHSLDSVRRSVARAPAEDGV